MFVLQQRGSNPSFRTVRWLGAAGQAFLNVVGCYISRHLKFYVQLFYFADIFVTDVTIARAIDSSPRNLMVNFVLSLPVSYCEKFEI